MLFFIGQKQKEIPLHIRYVFYIFALFPCAIVAGLRDDSVGADILVYGDRYFYAALSSDNFQSLIDQLGIAEPGYLMFNYLVSRFFSSSGWFYFFLSFTQMFFVFLGVYHWRDKFPIWFGMFVFYCFFFNSSMNLMRQTLALSIIFFATTFIFKKKPVLFYLLVCFATLFHYSAILGFSLHWLYIFLTKYKSNKAKLLLITFMLVAALSGEKILLFLSPLFDNIFQTFFGFKFNSERYLLYLEELREKDSINLVQFVTLFIIPIFFFMFRKNFFKAEYDHYLATLSLIIPFTTTQLHVLYGDSSSRMFHFIYWNIILLFPQIPLIVKRNQRAFVSTFVVVLCSFFWFWSCKSWWHNQSKDGMGWTIPYSSEYLEAFF
jgi:hypothetical protein